MTIAQYLRILNNIPDGKSLSKKDIDYGLLDIFPNHVVFLCRSALEISYGYINYMEDLWDGQSWRSLPSLKTSLRDDISLHCGKYETAENLIKATIEKLELYIEQHKDDNSSKGNNIDNLEIAANRFRTWLAEVDVLDDSPKTYRR